MLNLKTLFLETNLEVCGRSHWYFFTDLGWTQTPENILSMDKQLQESGPLVFFSGSLADSKGVDSDLGKHNGVVAQRWSISIGIWSVRTNVHKASVYHVSSSLWVSNCSNLQHFNFTVTNDLREVIWWELDSLTSRSFFVCYCHCHYCTNVC